MKYIILFLLPISLLGQNLTLSLDREDIKTLLTYTKQSMVYDTLTDSDKQKSVQSMERIIARNRDRGNVELHPAILAKWLDNQYYQIEEYYRAEKNYKQTMRLFYEVYLQDPKLKILKDIDTYGFGDRGRKQALRDIRRAEKDNDTTWLKRKYREPVEKLDEDGNLKQK